MNSSQPSKNVSRFLDPGAAAVVRRDLEFQRTWAAYLAQWRWHHFITLTFGSPASPIAARRRFQAWVRRLEQRAQQRVHSFSALERGMAGSMVHIHALTLGTLMLQTSDLVQAWSSGRSHVATYDRRRGAAFYVTKAIIWDDVEYDIDPPPHPVIDPKGS